MSVELSSVIEVQKDGKWEALTWYSHTQCYYNKKNHETFNRFAEAFRLVKNYKVTKGILNKKWSDLPGLVMSVLTRKAEEDEKIQYDAPIRTKAGVLNKHCELVFNNIDFRDIYMSGNYDNYSLANRGIPKDASKEARRYADGKYNYGHTYFTLAEILNIVESENEKFISALRKRNENELLYKIAKKLDVKGVQSPEKDYPFEEWYEDYSAKLSSVRYTYHYLYAIVNELCGYTPEENVRVVIWKS